MTIVCFCLCLTNQIDVPEFANQILLLKLCGEPKAHPNRQRFHHLDLPLDDECLPIAGCCRPYSKCSLRKQCYCTAFN